MRGKVLSGPFESIEHCAPTFGGQFSSHHVKTVDKVLLVCGAMNQMEMGTLNFRHSWINEVL